MRFCFWWFSLLYPLNWGSLLSGQQAPNVCFCCSCKISSALSSTSYCNWNIDYKYKLLFIVWDMVFCINITIYSAHNFKEITACNIKKLKHPQVTEDKVMAMYFNHIKKLYHCHFISLQQSLLLYMRGSVRSKLYISMPFILGTWGKTKD